MNKDWVEAMIPIADKIRRYHKHRVIGLKNIPKKGAAIIACNHSLATYDMMLLMSAIVTKLNATLEVLLIELFIESLI